ncbi:hypothetical protein CPB86DRAFT_783019 [Serendipita vermifera]|nr:hypothetical protein CPB86DRAFT_783019 [Serendipita vermifera]
MSFRPPRNLPVISIFHNPSSPPSVNALALLRKAKAEPYPSPPKAPLSFELSVVERLPTTDQFKTMQRYYGQPITTFLSAHPSSNEEGKGADEVERVRNVANKNPLALKYPLVVDWDRAKIAVGNLSDVKKILDGRAEERDRSGSDNSGNGEGEKKSIFGKLFGGS